MVSMISQGEFILPTAAPVQPLRTPGVIGDSAWQHNRWCLVSYHIQDKVRVSLIRHVDGHLNSVIAAGVAADSCAAQDRKRDGFAPTKHSSTISQTLDGDLSAFQEEGLSTQDVAGRGVSTQRGALTGSVPNFRSSRVIEYRDRIRRQRRGLLG
jgi:hypothetical protein